MHCKFVRIFACFVLGLFALRSLAQDTNEIVNLSLEQCIQLALQNNLDVRISRYQPEIAKLTLSGDYAAYEPAFDMTASQNFTEFEQGFDPSTFNPPSGETTRENYSAGIVGLLPTGFNYDISGNLNHSETEIAGRSEEEYASSIGISAQQPLLKNAWIDRTRWQIRIDKKQFKSSKLALINQIMQTVTQVQFAYYDLIAAQENVLVQEKALQLAQRLLEENRKRVQVGTMAPLDEKQAEAEVAARQADLLSAQNAQETQQNALIRLITDNFAGWEHRELEPSEALEAIPTSFSRMDSWQKGMTMRPDLLQSELELEQQDITLKFNRNQLFPQLDVFGSFGYTGRDPSFSPMLEDLSEQRNPRYSYGISLTIPLGNRQARTDYEIAKANKERLLLQHKQLEQQILVSIENAINEARSSLQRVQATRSAVEFAQAALEAEQKKLDNGKSTSFQVLQFQRDLISRQSAEINALADYNRALSNLALQEGYTLEKLNIDVTFQEQ